MGICPAAFEGSTDRKSHDLAEGEEPVPRREAVQL